MDFYTTLNKSYTLSRLWIPHVENGKVRLNNLKYAPAIKYDKFKKQHR